MPYQLPLPFGDLAERVRATPIHPTNAALMLDIRARWYSDVLQMMLQDAADAHGLPDCLDYLTDAMRKYQEYTEILIQERFDQGVITSPDQSRKSVAGNAYQALVALALAQCQAASLIDRRIILALKPRRHAAIMDYATIQIADEYQRPDVDLLVLREDDNEGPIGVFSMKTSLRERAGQTYRWKLLYDIATAENAASLKKRYGIVFPGRRRVVVSLITADFYGEAGQPQQRGSFSFFDGVYISKPVAADGLVRPLSHVCADMNATFKEPE